MGNLSLSSTITAVERDREFWRRVLLAGGFTALPRWTLDPVAGVGEHEARIPDELAAVLRRLGDELGGAVRPGAVDRARQGAGRILGRARGMHRLRPAARVAVATAYDPWIPFVARGAARRCSSRDGTVGAQGFSSRRSPARAGPPGTAVR